MTSPRRIVIAGAGIGGLTAALALAARGFAVTICEKAPRLEEVGAGLQLSPNASRILTTLGLAPRLEAHAVRPPHVSIMTARSGGMVTRLPLASPDAPYWLLHRADLQTALCEAALASPLIDLRLGEAISDISTYGTLIGADGVWSAVREKMFPDMRPSFSGLIAWRGTCDAQSLPAALRPTGVQLWMGPRAHLVIYPMSAGTRVNMVAILPGAEIAPGWSEPGAADEIVHAFGDANWPQPARTMIAAVTNWRRWPLFTMRDGGAWHAGRVALLGDAAHAMLPFAAQGAGMAIEDAAVLAECLAATTADGDIPAALERYAAQRQPRVTRMQRLARQSGRIYHLTGAMALARDTTMRLLGPDRLQARQDWIYHWRP